MISTSSGERKIPVVASHGTASWIDEEAAYPESDDSFGQVTIGAHKLATMMKLDSLFDAFEAAPEEAQREVLLNTLKLITARDRMADLSWVGGSKCAGCIQPTFSKELNSANGGIVFIDQSVTGMFERRQRIGL